MRSGHAPVVLVCCSGGEVMKKNGAIALGVVLLLVTAGTVRAEPVMQRFDQLTQTCRAFTMDNVWAGYAAFRNVCKGCHARNNSANAPFLYSESKTQKGWSRVFSKMYPGCAKDGSWAGLSPEDLLNLHDYLFVDAFGHYDPKKAGSCFS